MNVALTRAKSGLVVIGDLKNSIRGSRQVLGRLARQAGVRCAVDDFDSPEDEPVKPDRCSMQIMV
jgi:superfamily I DNA and/or RNA helicase